MNNNVESIGRCVKDQIMSAIFDLSIPKFWLRGRQAFSHMFISGSSKLALALVFLKQHWFPQDRSHFAILAYNGSRY